MRLAHCIQHKGEEGRTRSRRRNVSCCLQLMTAWVSSSMEGMGTPRAPRREACD